MTDQELIEALARKLAFLDLGAGCNWDVLAAECLRQMRWAARNVYVIPDGNNIEKQARLAYVETLAPDDWKP